MKYKFRIKHSPKELREQRVDSLKKELSEAKSFVLFSSSNVTHQQFEELRTKLTETDTKLRFVKNTLFRISAESLKFPKELYAEDILQGPTAAILVMGDDFVASLKALKAVFGQTETVKVKIGFLDQAVYGGSQVLEFAKIPSPEELRAKLVGMIKSPLYGLHRALSYDTQRLAVVLTKIGEKGGDTNG